MLWLEPWDLDYLALKTRVVPGTDLYRTLRLRHVEGHSYPAIAAEQECSIITVGTRLNRWRRRLARYPWNETEKPYLRAILDESDRLEDSLLLQEAQTIFLLLRGKQPSRPPSPLYDELGRRVGAPATLFSVGDIYRLLRIREEREEMLRAEGRRVDENARSGIHYSGSGCATTTTRS
jgi:hypothetical protein